MKNCTLQEAFINDFFLILIPLLVTALLFSLAGYFLGRSKKSKKIVVNSDLENQYKKLQQKYNDLFISTSGGKIDTSNVNDVTIKNTEIIQNNFPIDATAENNLIDSKLDINDNLEEQINQVKADIPAPILEEINDPIASNLPEIVEEKAIIDSNEKPDIEALMRRLGISTSYNVKPIKTDENKIIATSESILEKGEENIETPVEVAEQLEEEKPAESIVEVSEENIETPVEVAEQLEEEKPDESIVEVSEEIIETPFEVAEQLEEKKPDESIVEVSEEIIETPVEVAEQLEEEKPVESIVEVSEEIIETPVEVAEQLEEEKPDESIVEVSEEIIETPVEVAENKADLTIEEIKALIAQSDNPELDELKEKLGISTQLTSEPEIINEFAKYFGTQFKKDDLKLIEGIGPKIASILNEKNINTWYELSEASSDDIKKWLFEIGGATYKIHDPITWPLQAKLAYEEKYEDLKKLQDVLKRGKV